MRPAIVYVTPYYPPYGPGGAERTTQMHAHILTRRGWHVIVATLDIGDLTQDQDDGVEVIRIPLVRDKLRQIGEALKGRMFRNLDFQRAFAQKIIQQLQGRELLCIHSQTFHVAIAASLAAKQRDLPFIYHIRDTSTICQLGAVCQMSSGHHLLPARCGLHDEVRCYMTQTLPLYENIHPREDEKAHYTDQLRAVHKDVRQRRWICRNADRVVFASHGLKQLYQQLHDFRYHERYHVVYAPALAWHHNTQDKGSMHLPQVVLDLVRGGHPYILYVGKVSKGKGCDVLFAAHKTLLKEFPNAYLVIAGNVHGAWDNDADRTITLGFLNDLSIQALYAYCDFVVMPSTWPEPLGWPAIHAGRHAKAIVATRVCGVPEAVQHQRTGLLVEKLDAEGLAGAMGSLLAGRDLKKRLGDNAHKHIYQHFGESAVGRQLESLYEGLAPVAC